MISKLFFKSTLTPIQSATRFWFMSLFIFFLLNILSRESDLTQLFKFIYPLLVILPLYFFTKLFNNKLFAYFLFFSISITSVLGFTESLTGAYAEPVTPVLFGMSFYTAALGYYIIKNKFTKANILYAINPLIIISGPIAINIKDISYKKFSTRANYFIPYIILGLFLNQAISTPMTETFFLISEVDAISAILFAIIFELFVYANFCGISLIIFGLSGLLGYKVPLNFKQPFSASNLRDFWKGWHVTLSEVLKTLFYNPIKKKFNTTLAALFVFFVSAMWHGVSINFLIWGIFHGTCLVCTIFFLKKDFKIIPIFLMIFGLVFGRMIFADSDFGRLILKLQMNFTDLNAIYEILNLSKVTLLSLIFMVLFVTCEFVFKNNKYFIGKNYKFYRLPYVRELLLILTFLMISSNLGVDYAVYGQR